MSVYREEPVSVHTGDSLLAARHHGTAEVIDMLVKGAG